VIDISDIEGRDPIDDYRVLRQELESYRPEMLNKPFLVALNKIDVEGAEEQVRNFRKKIDLPASLLFEISAMNQLGLSPLIEAICTLGQAHGKRFYTQTMQNDSARRN